MQRRTFLAAAPVVARLANTSFPRTSLMWRFLAPKLAGNHTLIRPDPRGYGRSGIPASTDDHFPYSKRAMAKELVEVMAKLGFPTFTLIGHDRGGRVAPRTARLAVFDVIPILEAWNRSDARYAQTYWPWIRRPFSITALDRVRSDRKFSMSTFPPIAIRRVFMVFVRSSELRPPSMWNRIVPIRRLYAKDGGHFFPEENPDDTAALLNQFLRS